jgi:molybdenum cofactor cytidylyltransferase
MSVAAIVLAAGRGTRFGAAPKMLATISGKSLVRRVTEAALTSEASPVVVVTGHAAADVEAALSGMPVILTRNASYADGLSTSLKAGFGALPPEAEAAIVLLGDMPLVQVTLIDRLLQAWRGNGRPAALVPTLDGRRGNPVVLSRVLASDIASLAGDSGAGPLLRGRSDVIEWPVADPAVHEDVDTQQALEALRR